jgi:hypothetical protein
MQTGENAGLEKVRVAMFADAYGVEPKEARLGAILDAIRTGKYANEIQRARELFAAWKAGCPALDSKESPEAKAYDAFKRTLPAFCVSGTAKGRKEPLEHSGLMQVDCDKLNGALETLREKLKADRHVAFGFVSPSGEGLKLGLVIDGTRHTESFEAARQYFREHYGVEIDPQVKDRLRLCFVSDDSALWTRPDCEPLPIPNAKTDSEAPANEGGELSPIILPSGSVSISDSARQIFSRIAPTRTLFWRGGAIVEMVEQDGVSSLEILKPEAFRSRAERHGQVFAWRCDGEGRPVLKPTKMPRDDAAAIMAAVEAQEILPPVASVVRCAVLVESGEGAVEILGKGYHPEFGGLLIVAGETPPRVELATAVAALKRLVEQFDFQSEGDRSRALAALITPALVMGGFFNGRKEHVPMDVAEADFSQAGKGYRHSLVCALYNQWGYFITARSGGVGSMDESFGAALVAGRPIVTIDNLRGKLDSQHLEAFLTCPTHFPARIPHHGEVLVNPRRFLLQMSSNGLETTRDLANRASICRIRKRPPTFHYRDTLAEIEKDQPFFLGCVFAVVAEWIAQGKPQTDDMRHSFKKWNQTLDWIVQKILGCAPLMDDHEAAQERVSNPALSWIRALALLVVKVGRMGRGMIASELVELCQIHGLEIPGAKETDEERAKMKVGMLMRRVFKDAPEIKVDGYKVNRDRREFRKPSGDLDFTPEYTFNKEGEPTQPPQTTQSI